MAEGYTTNTMVLGLYEGVLHNLMAKLDGDNTKDIISKCDSLEPAIRAECKVAAAALRQIPSELRSGTTNARLKLLLERFRTSLNAELGGQRMLILSEAEQAALDAPQPIALQAPTSDDPSHRKGGRPSGKHGEPIARLTIKLLKLPPEELVNFKAASLAYELIDEFKALKLLPPSLDNAERDAAGILRAVRS